MPNHPFQTRTDWTATASAVSLATGRFYDRLYLRKVANGTERNARLAALLATHEVKKVDWREVASFMSECRPTPYKPRYVYEIALGHIRQKGRKNNQLCKQLVKYGVIDAMRTQEEEKARRRGLA